jgi:glucokinase
MQQFYLGVEIGGSKLQLVLGDASARIIRRWRLAVDPREGGSGIREKIRATLAEVTSGAVLAGAGVGFGGPVDWRTGRICCSHQIEGWAEFDLRDWLQSMIKAPVLVDNDGNTAALGEAFHGSGKGFNPVFYVTLGSGVGGGLVEGGRIFHGATPGEAEIGHVRLDRSGATVEERCSGWAVDRKIRSLIACKPGCCLGQLASGRTGGEAKHLKEALARGDEEASRIVMETSHDLAFGLSHVIHLFHPEVIVIGGGLSLIGEALRTAVADAIPQFVMKAFAPGPQVRLAALGEDAVPVGALELARNSKAD